MEDSSGQFVKTLGRWSNSYRRELVTWWGKVSTPLDAETAGGVVLYVIRANGSDGVVGVDYAVTGLSATSGEDFNVGGGTVTFADGDTASKSISIAIVDDATTEPVETFTVTLSTPSGGATLGANDTTTVSIIDDDDPNPIGPGVIEFGQGNYTAEEGSGLATVELLRSRGTQGAVSVDINTGDGTALSDLDYESLTETVTFDDGDAGPRVVTIRLVDDTDIELRESFVVTLSQASGGAIIGTIRDAEVQIVDDDAHSTNIALEGRMVCNNAKSAPGVLMALMIGLMAIRPGRRRRRSGHRDDR